MKKLLVTLMIAAMTVGMTGCGSKEEAPVCPPEAFACSGSGSAS